MVSSFKIWFRNFLQPKITQVHVEIFENGKHKEIKRYSEQQILVLLKAVDALWKVEKHSPYWFETDLYEISSCFRERKAVMIVTCYTQDMFHTNFKKQFGIPPKHRKRMFDKVHTLSPDPVGFQTWPNLEVKFVLDK